MDDLREPTSTGEQRPGHERASKIVTYAALSLGCFLCFLVLVALLLWKAPMLAALGLTGNFYYFALVPLGLSASGFVFGALRLRSYASYSGQHFGGKLELGGAAVVFPLVIILGFVLLPKSFNFPLTVYVHGAAGPQDLVLTNSGYVLLDIGGDRRRELIGEKGQAFFPEIPSNFRGRSVNVSLDAAGYELANPGQERTLSGTSLYLEVRKKTGHVTGHVRDEKGAPLAGISIAVAGVAVTSDTFGQFDVVIPGDRLQPTFLLQAVAKGFVPWSNNVVPNANEVTITLRRQH